MIEITCINTGEQVGEYVNNRIDPELFGHKVKEVGERFSHPYVVVESNNHGVLTLAVLDKVYPTEKIHVDVYRKGDEDSQLMGLGMRTTSRTKPLVVGRLRALLAEGLVVHSPLLNTELNTFIEHENGKLAAQDGCHDDTVMAMACSVRGINEAAMQKASELSERAGRRVQVVDPFQLESIINEMQRKGQQYPISSQLDITIH